MRGPLPWTRLNGAVQEPVHAGVQATPFSEADDTGAAANFAAASRAPGIIRAAPPATRLRSGGGSPLSDRTHHLRAIVGSLGVTEVRLGTADGGHPSRRADRLDGPDRRVYTGSGRIPKVDAG